MDKVSVRSAFLAPFRQAGWLRALLVGNLLMFVPLVGPIAIQGYCSRVLKDVAGGGVARPLPGFDGLKECLSEGMVPFMSYMIWVVPINAVLYVMVFVGIMVGGIMTAIIGSITGQSNGGLVGVLFAAFVSIAVTIGLIPTLILVRHALAADTLVDVTGKLEYSWKLREIRAYIKILGAEGWRAFAGLMLGNAIVVLMGMAMLVMGVFLVPFILAFAMAHLQGQLYSLYIRRGGKPYQLMGATN